ncbi:hypothetical protein CDAR_306921 [Caerostris darwini]|uniref:Uncharacterized protein n=1 Tax=Caerostris darwini TaxID=1538125 RepID=A0AAV4QWL9_9ARAC|nr:hypothetical protein CDAR_306921 [Caerostris darwini]
MLGRVLKGKFPRSRRKIHRLSTRLKITEKKEDRHRKCVDQNFSMKLRNRKKQTNFMGIKLTSPSIMKLSDLNCSINVAMKRNKRLNNEKNHINKNNNKKQKIDTSEMTMVAPIKKNDTKDKNSLKSSKEKGLKIRTSESTRVTRSSSQSFLVSPLFKETRSRHSSKVSDKKNSAKKTMESKHVQPTNRTSSSTKQNLNSNTVNNYFQKIINIPIDDIITTPVTRSFNLRKSSIIHTSKSDSNISKRKLSALYNDDQQESVGKKIKTGGGANNIGSSASSTGSKKKYTEDFLTANLQKMEGRRKTEPVAADNTRRLAYNTRSCTSSAKSKRSNIKYVSQSCSGINMRGTEDFLTADSYTKASRRKTKCTSYKSDVVRTSMGNTQSKRSKNKCTPQKSSGTNIEYKEDFLTADLQKKQTKRKNKLKELTCKSDADILGSSTSNAKSKKSQSKCTSQTKRGRRRTEPVKSSNPHSVQEKKRGKSTGDLGKKPIRKKLPMQSTPKRHKMLFNKFNSALSGTPVTPDITKIPVDDLTISKNGTTFPFPDDKFMITPAKSKKKFHSLPIDNKLDEVGKKKRKTHKVSGSMEKSSTNTLLMITPVSYKKKAYSLPIKSKLDEISKERKMKKQKVSSCSTKKSSASGLKAAIPGKGTLKRDRWLFNTMKEKNDGYEDDIFESKKINLFKAGFMCDEESDTSSVNIATPKFGCMLTPALPKKTPRFQDCISSAELLLARKNAEEYRYRRKKRFSGNETPGCSTSRDSLKNDSAKSAAETTKLVDALVSIQQNLEKNTFADNEEEDHYFSDASY